MMEQVRPKAADKDVDAWVAPLRQGRAAIVFVQSAVTKRRTPPGSLAAKRCVRSAVRQ